MPPKELDIDKLLDHSDAFAEGLKKGKELAIQRYDRMFLELYEKMQQVENKLDSFIHSLEKFTVKKRD